MDWEEPLSSLTEGSTACSGLPVPQQDILFISQRVILPHHFVACYIQSFEPVNICPDRLTAPQPRFGILLA